MEVKLLPGMEWLTAPHRRGYLVLVIALVFAVPLTIYNNKRQDESTARAARVATLAANAKVAKAFRRQQRLYELDNWKRARAACGRGNIVRAAISQNTRKTQQLALELAASRRIASGLETSAALARHDLNVANGYVRLAKSLVVINRVDCSKKYPYPFQKGRHQ